MTARVKETARLPAALNPESLAVVQPWKDWINRGLVTVTVTFKPTGTECVGELLTNIADRKAGEKLSVGLIRDILTSAGYGKTDKKKNNNTKEEPLPAKSLCARDMEAGGPLLEKRAVSVANAVGGTAAAGRITSMKLFKDGCDTIDKWWAAATPSEKVKLLTTEKYYKAMSDEQVGVLTNFVTMAKCPFREATPLQLPKELEKPSEEVRKVKAEPSKSSGSRASPRK